MKKYDHPDRIDPADIAEFEANGGRVISLSTPCCSKEFYLKAPPLPELQSGRYQCHNCGIPFTFNETTRGGIYH